MNRFLRHQKFFRRKFSFPIGKRLVFSRKMAGWISLGVFLLGATILVGYAISSPELPPNNLVSTFNSVSGYPGGAGPSLASIVILPSTEETTWANLTGLNEQDMQTGAGTQEADRTKDIEYNIRPGETLS